MEDTTPPPKRRRRRVYMTAGLTASAAVLAMSVQAGAQSDDNPPSTGYGDTSSQDVDDAEA